jgi:hypothetical protein
MRRSLAALTLVAGLLVACGGQAPIPPQTTAPAAAASLQPTAIPTPLAAATPTLSVTPAPTDVPSAVPTPPFAPFRLAGTGSKVAEFTLPHYYAAIVTITNKGSSHFVVSTLDQGGTLLQPLVNVDGNFTGTVLLESGGFDLAFEKYAAAFDIVSDGAWTMVVKPTTAARRWDPTTKLSGRGDDVVLVRPPSSGLTTLWITHDGRSSFYVTAHPMSTRYHRIVLAHGRYEAAVDLPDGTVILTVEADGAWTIGPL